MLTSSTGHSATNLFDCDGFVSMDNFFPPFEASYYALAKRERARVGYAKGLYAKFSLFDCRL